MQPVQDFEAAFEVAFIDVVNGTVDDQRVALVDALLKCVKPSLELVDFTVCGVTGDMVHLTSSDSL